MMVTVLPHKSAVVTITVTIAEVLGFTIVKESSKKWVDDSRDTIIGSTLPAPASYSVTLRLVDEVNMSQFLADVRVLVGEH